MFTALAFLPCWRLFGRGGILVNMPPVGEHVRLRGREGVVSRASLGTMKRQGDELVSSGAWIEVVLGDGRGPANHLRLHEDDWGELEILGY